MPGQHDPVNQTPAGMNPTWRTDGAWREQARTMCYWRYCRPGDLVFDIGANIGEVTRVLLELGCRVVAVEPQAEVAAEIPPAAEVVVAAVGSSAGTATFHAVETNPALSSMRPDVVDAATSFNPAWVGKPRQVDVVTMDDLIDTYGVPVFAKIDVEGFEVEVLNGLSQPLRALSFEVHSFDLGKIGACIERLDVLSENGYGYLYSPTESYELQPFPPPSYAWFGDVYANLRTPAE